MPSKKVVANCPGLRFVLSADDPKLLPRLTHRLPPEGYRDTNSSGSRADDGPRELQLRVTGRPPVIEQDGSSLDRPACEDDLFDSLERHVDRLVAEHSPDHLALHAGVVGFGDGALLVAGSSRSGKSTLVRSLVPLGARFLSDDLAMVDESLRVHPYPRALRHRQGSREHRLDPERLFPGLMGTHPLPVRWIVLPTYRDGAGFEPSVLAGGAAVLALLRHSLSARSAPQRSLGILGRLAQSVPVWKGERGDAVETAEAICRLIGFPSSPRP